MVAGDFNSWYRMWDPEVIQTRNDGQEIAAWASDQQLDYIGEPGVPTQDGRYTIDLVFSNIPHATARVIDRLHPGRDHEGILITLPQAQTIRLEQQRLAIPDCKLETFTGLVELGVCNLPQLPETPAREDIDTAAAALLAALREAAAAVQKQPKDNYSAPWWTEKYRTALKAYHKARRDNTGDPLLEERKEFLQVVRKEKDSYWIGRIDGIKSDKDLYEIVQ